MPKNSFEKIYDAKLIDSNNEFVLYSNCIKCGSVMHKKFYYNLQHKLTCPACGTQHIALLTSKDAHTNELFMKFYERRHSEKRIEKYRKKANITENTVGMEAFQ